MQDKSDSTEGRDSCSSSASAGSVAWYEMDLRDELVKQYKE